MLPVICGGSRGLIAIGLSPFKICIAASADLSIVIVSSSSSCTSIVSIFIPSSSALELIAITSMSSISSDSSFSFFDSEFSILSFFEIGASHGFTTNESECFSDESSKSNSTISGFSNGFSVDF